MSQIVVDIHRTGEPQGDLPIEKAWSEAARRNLAHLRDVMARVGAHHVEIPFDAKGTEWEILNVEFVSAHNSTIQVDLAKSRVAVAGVYSRDNGPTFTVDEELDSLAVLGGALGILILGAASPRMGAWDGALRGRWPDAFGTIFVKADGEVEVDLRKRLVVKSSWRLSDVEATTHYATGAEAPALTQIPEPRSVEGTEPAH